MTRRTYGKLYNDKLRTKEIAEIVRRQVRLEARMGLLPDGKWSVTMDRYAGGSSITIAFSPKPAEDELFARAYYNHARIVHEAERPHEYAAIPYRSRFGSLLVRRLEQMLADHNHDGSDPMQDIYDVKFAAHVSVRPETTERTLVDLHRGGCLPETSVRALKVAWADMLAAWEKEIAPAEPTPEPAEPTPEPTPVEMLARRGHLRLVPTPTPTPVETAARMVKDGMTKLERDVVEICIDRTRPLARARKPLAVPVEEPVPQAPSDAWLRLAMAGDLNLDFEIPGLGERR